MSIWEKNKQLWRDSTSFDKFFEETIKLSVAFSKNEFDAKDFLIVANNLDDLMQSYENNYGPIEDPLFFLVFAQANALFLQVGKEFDELGATRIGYIVNSFKEALTKHLLYPTFDETVLQSIDDTFMQFANDYDKNWFTKNRYKFFPVSSLQ
jgi:hypothetical protein